MVIKQTRIIPVAVLIILLCLVSAEAAAVIAGKVHEQAVRRRTEESCLLKNEAEKKACWERVVQGYIKKADIAGAYTVLAKLYDENPSFGETCHALTHEIGASAYTLFSRGIRFDVSPKTSYCSYGFYHGFMEKLVSAHSDLSEARKFCEYVDKQISKVSPDVTLQCYHGIGHGTVNNHDPRTWGDEQKLLDPAIALCGSVAVTAEQKSRCITGVFNGLANFYADGEYKLKFNTKDPFAVCRKQDPRYQDECYISLNTLALQTVNNDLGKAALLLADVADETIARHTMVNFAAPLSIQYPVDRFGEMVSACRALAPRLRLACIQGFAFGYLEHGQPEQEYVLALDFCKQPALTADEQNACYDYILSYLPMWYSSQKVTSICSALPDVRRRECLSKNSVQK
jgi:hypothetical protein